VRILIALSIAVPVLALAAPAAASSVDQAFAEAAVLTQADAPAGFTGGPFEDSDADPVLPACKGAIAKADRAVEASPIARSGFQLGDTEGYAQIESTVAVLNTEKRAKQAMAAYRKVGAGTACVMARLEDAFTETGVTTSVDVGKFAPELDDKGSTRVITGGDEFLGFSGSIRRTAGGAPQLFDSQVVLARDGRAVTQLVMVTSGTIPRADAQRMLQAVVGRMDGA